MMALATQPREQGDRASRQDPGEPLCEKCAPERLGRVIDEYYALVWRTLRRLGVPSPVLDDAIQAVFLVTSRKLGSVPERGERGFLIEISVKTAANARRAARRDRMVSASDELDQHTSAGLAPDQALEQSQARAMLDMVLEELPEELRTVFVLTELEGMTMAEIGTLLEVPAGTVASRLRRGRELFAAAASRLRARIGWEGGTR